MMLWSSAKKSKKEPTTPVKEPVAKDEDADDDDDDDVMVETPKAEKKSAKKSAKKVKERSHHTGKGRCCERRGCRRCGGNEECKEIGKEGEKGDGNTKKGGE